MSLKVNLKPNYNLRNSSGSSIVASSKCLINRLILSLSDDIYSWVQITPLN